MCGMISEPSSLPPKPPLMVDCLQISKRVNAFHLIVSGKAYYLYPEFLYFKLYQISQKYFF